MKLPPSSKTKCKKRFNANGVRPTDLLAVFFVAGLAFIFAGALLAMLNFLGLVHGVRWLILHLIFIGGVSQLIIGSGQFFAGAFLATGPAPRWMIRLMFATWNIGVLVLAFGVQFHLTALISAGGTLVLVGLVTFEAALSYLKRTSIQRAPWATRWYRASAGLLMFGSVIGILIAHGVRSSADLYSAHMTLNLVGWFGLAIVGTLHTYYPSLSETRLQYPRLQWPTYMSWFAGTLVLASGFALSLPALVVFGVVSLIVSSIMLLVNIVGSTIRARFKLALPAQIVGTAQVFLPLGLICLLVGLAKDGDVLVGSMRSVTATFMLIGWVGLTVVGSLIHLLTLLGRVRNFAAGSGRRSAPMWRHIGVMSAIAIFVLGVCQILGVPVLVKAITTLVAAVYLVFGVMIVRLALSAARAAPLRL